MSETDITAIPEGWKLVPIAPTDDMVKAGITAWQNVEISQLAQAPASCEIAIYKAMVVAAPNLN